MDVTLEVDISAQIKRLQVASDNLDLDALLDAGAEYLLTRIQTRFLGETAPDGTKWVPSRAAIREGRRTGYKTGRLYHSLTWLDTGADERSIATGVPYAVTFALGLYPGGVPRPFMGVNPSDEEGLNQVIQARAALMLGGG